MVEGMNTTCSVRHRTTYVSPLGPMVLASVEGDGAAPAALCGAWFVGQKHYPTWLESVPDIDSLPGVGAPDVSAQAYLASSQSAASKPSASAALLFAQARRWLDVYFEGGDPGPTPSLAFVGTEFRVRVWKLLLDIPRGQTTTYGDLGRELHKQQPAKGVSAQAVGGAVGHNPLSLFVPCHRVIGANGAVTGYAGGVEKKVALLRLEGVELCSLPPHRKH